MWYKQGCLERGEVDGVVALGLEALAALCESGGLRFEAAWKLAHRAPVPAGALPRSRELALLGFSHQLAGSQPEQLARLLDRLWEACEDASSLVGQPHGHAGLLTLSHTHAHGQPHNISVRGHSGSLGVGMGMGKYAWALLARRIAFMQSQASGLQTQQDVDKAAAPASCNASVSIQLPVKSRQGSLS